ncbi:hypothetical protein Q3G72_008573 [Acer saccharum]|nr:hypothetical protein Q3G72_008573 [Acer saccharum]
MGGTHATDGQDGPTYALVSTWVPRRLLCGAFPDSDWPEPFELAIQVAFTLWVLFASSLSVGTQVPSLVMIGVNPL